VARSPLSLTGQWHGTYAYPNALGPATPFIADIVETETGFGGSIIEPETILATGDTMTADLAGHRAALAVDFTKTYRGRRYGYEYPVDYVGRLSADGMSIEGVWSLLDMNGTFEMHREIGLGETQQNEERMKVPIGRN